MERWGEIEVKFLARKCVQMKREQADKLCSDGVGGWLGELECRLPQPHRRTRGLDAHLYVHRRRKMHENMFTQVLLHSFTSLLLWPSSRTLVRPNKSSTVPLVLLNSCLFYSQTCLAVFFFFCPDSPAISFPALGTSASRTPNRKQSCFF